MAQEYNPNIYKVYPDKPIDVVLTGQVFEIKGKHRKFIENISVVGGQVKSFIIDSSKTTDSHLSPVFHLKGHRKIFKKKFK